MKKNKNNKAENKEKSECQKKKTNQNRIIEARKKNSRKERIKDKKRKKGKIKAEVMKGGGKRNSKIKVINMNEL